MTLPLTVPGPRVVGIDLSLNSTGVAIIAEHRAWTTTLIPKWEGHPAKGHRRLQLIADKITEWCADADLILIEGAAFGMPNQAFQMGGAWYVVTHALWNEGQPYVVVPPACIKKYATGKGNAKKDLVGYEAVRRFPSVMMTTNDEADALWLAHMGCDWLGWPLITVPLANRTAMDSIRTWPDRLSIRKFPAPDPSRIAREA
jgi:Holliday junction resolvasome RuvABC endonuclease subunit